MSAAASWATLVVAPLGQLTSPCCSRGLRHGRGVLSAGAEGVVIVWDLRADR